MTTINTNYNSIKVTDAHVHFWDIAELEYPWLDEVPTINRTFGLDDYQQAATGLPIERMIFVQCECLPEQYRQEVAYVSRLATQDNRICGIVPYFPLEAGDAEIGLQPLLSNPLVKGIRRLQEEATSLYDNPAFVAAFDLLRQHDLSFDLCVKAHQLPAAVRLVEQQPGNRYMLDHFGKPNIKAGGFANWKSRIMTLAGNPNVYCKLSGLVTEADWQHWSICDLRPYVETVLECFGTNRVVFGGDWPVVTLAATYGQWLGTAITLCDGLTAAEKHRVFYQNALDFYRID